MEPIIHSPFGPKICGWKMPEKIVDILNQDCEHVTSPDNLDTHLNSWNLIGQIKVQANFGDLVGKEERQWFKNRAIEYTKLIGIGSQKFKFQALWYNRTMKPGEYNPHHIHPQALLTSVGYLKLPNNYKEELTKPQKNGVSGGLELFYGEQSNYCTTQMTIIPGVGDFYIFPAMLRHAVYPMPDTITEERRSFSINFGPG
jgi:hypothetical protein